MKAATLSAILLFHCGINSMNLVWVVVGIRDAIKSSSHSSKGNFSDDIKIQNSINGVKIIRSVPFNSKKSKTD